MNGALKTTPGRVIPRSYQINDNHRFYEAVKFGFDKCMAALLGILALPILLLAAVLVKLTSPGPVFYSQVRVGKKGQLFTIYKIRTMFHNCESHSGPRWSKPGDPRITNVGRFLRRTHLDELPQLINVLLGHMSLIGPRPERPEFLPVLEEAISEYRQRLRVRPGVTGLAQIQLAADTDLNSVRRKLAHDLYYIKHMSPWLDLRIMLGTVAYVFGVPLAISQRLLGLPDLQKIGSQVTHSARSDNLSPGGLRLHTVVET
jgi:lipopolysaccharide/colanic/teichoic acid biosynthesis glycosyltransferase